EAGGFDRARGEQEGIGRRGAAVARWVDVLDRPHVAAVVQEARDRRVEAQLAASRQERAAQGGDGRRVLRVVRAAPATAKPAIDARWATVVEARVDRRREGVRVDRLA